MQATFPKALPHDFTSYLRNLVGAIYAAELFEAQLSPLRFQLVNMRKRVESVWGIDPPVPAHLQQLLDKPQQFETIDNLLDALQQLIILRI